MTTRNEDGDAARAERVAKAYALHTEKGWGSYKVAAALGVSQATAHRYIREGRNAIPWLELLDLNDARAAQAARLTKYVEMLIEEVDSGTTRVVEAMPSLLKIEERWAKLAGLDAPSRHVIENPKAAPDPAVLQALRELEQREDERDE